MSDHPTALDIPILLRPVDWQNASDRQLPVLLKNHQSITTWPNKDVIVPGI